MQFSPNAELQRGACISIVSHRHACHINTLLDKFRDKHIDCLNSLILTININEEFDINIANLNFPVKIIKNKNPLGFAENHNNAFRFCDSEIFMVCNPDIIIDPEAIENLVMNSYKEKNTILAPTVVDKNLIEQVNYRTYPTFFEVSLKFLLILFGKKPKHRGRVSKPSGADWIAGMFLVIPSEIFKDLNGFCNLFYLYYEDVDFGFRAKKKGYRLWIDPTTVIIHEGQYTSHRKISYFLTHIISFFIFKTRQRIFKFFI